MPTYEYKCEDCGNKFEKFQSMKDKTIAKCPNCGGKVQRLISSGGVLFSSIRAFMQLTMPRVILQLVGETDPATAEMHLAIKSPANRKYPYSGN